MATKYWYKAANGSDNWSVAANWYLGSGGTGGTTTVPGNTDDVILDVSSGNGTITLAASASCRSLVATTFTGTLTGASSLTLAGSNGGSQGSGKTIELGTGMTYSLSGGLSLAAVTSSGSINFNGKSHSTGTMTINAAAGIWTLAGNLTTTGQIAFVAGSLTTNGNPITCSVFSISGAGIRTLNLGSSLINLTGTGSPWSFVTSATNVTFNAGTSTIRFSDTSNASCIFLGNGQTYYNFEVSRSGSTGIVQIQSASNLSNNTFFNFIDNTGTSAHDILFTSLTTQTFQNFNVKGFSSSARVRFVSTVPVGGLTTLVKTGAGAVICDYLDIGTAVTSVTPANTWYAGYNSTGTGIGWIFRNPLGLLTMGVGG
jgi:hypothetical protein